MTPFFVSNQPTSKNFFEHNFLLPLQNYAKARGPSRWWSERLFQATSRNWLKKVLRMLNAWLMNAMPQKAWTKSRSTFMYHINELKYFLKEIFYTMYWNFILMRIFLEIWAAHLMFSRKMISKFQLFFDQLQQVLFVLFFTSFCWSKKQSLSLKKS